MQPHGSCPVRRRRWSTPCATSWGRKRGECSSPTTPCDACSRSMSTGPVGAPNPMAGTIAGRAFTSGEVTVSGGQPTVVSIPLVDGTDRIGLLELDYDAWDGGLPAGWERVVAVFVLVLIADEPLQRPVGSSAPIRTAVGGGGDPVGSPATVVVFDRRRRRRRDPRARLRDRRGLLRLRGQRRAPGVRHR